MLSVEGFSSEIVSDNGAPFNSHDFALFLSSHSIKHTTSPQYPQSNGFIEEQIQTDKNLLFKAIDADTWSFQQVLAFLRSTRIRNGLPSPAETLYGRNSVTGEPITVDHATVRATLQKRQAKYSQSHKRSHKVKKQRALLLGERC